MRIDLFYRIFNGNTDRRSTIFFGSYKCALNIIGINKRTSAVMNNDVLTVINCIDCVFNALLTGIASDNTVRK